MNSLLPVNEEAKISINNIFFTPGTSRFHLLNIIGWGDLTHKVTQLEAAMPGHEDVAQLHVAMHDAPGVQPFHSLQQLQTRNPDFSNYCMTALVPAALSTTLMCCGHGQL